MGNRLSANAILFAGWVFYGNWVGLKLQLYLSRKGIWAGAGEKDSRGRYFHVKKNRVLLYFTVITSFFIFNLSIFNHIIEAKANNPDKANIVRFPKNDVKNFGATWKFPYTDINEHSGKENHVKLKRIAHDNAILRVFSINKFIRTKKSQLL